jgi:nucleotide-binding universal stress UspA family protein
MNRILVPYDGSTPSENALNQAIKLAKSMREKVEIVILNVVQEILAMPAMTETRFRSTKTGEQVSFSELSKEICQEMKNAASRDLEEKKRKIDEKEASARIGIGKGNSDDKKYNFVITTKVLVGYPPDKVVEFAADEKFDLIIIGNTGLSGISKFKALGSVSRSVAERAKCPVMIVH